MTLRIVHHGDDIFQVVAIIWPDGHVEPIEVIFVPALGLARVVRWDELNDETQRHLLNAFQ